MLDATKLPPVATDDETDEEPAKGAPDATPKGPQTVEEANAYWQKRMSGKDRAAAAAEQVLREQLAAAEAKANAATTSAGQPAEGGNAEAEQLRKELEQERRGRAIDARKAKYPAAAAGLSDEMIAVADEAKLAALQERLADEPGNFIAPTGPRRPAAPAAGKSLDEKSVAELEADLRAASPGYKSWLEETTG